MCPVRMHADEIETDAPLVRRLLAAQLPEWSRLPVEPLPSEGTDNALYRLGDDMVVRLPKRARTSGTLEKERRWLPRLAPVLPLAVPLPLADGRPTDSYPCEWAVYRWLEGADATVAPPGDPTLLASDLAAFITALQRIDTSGAPSPGQDNFGRGEPLAARTPQREARSRPWATESTSTPRPRCGTRRCRRPSGSSRPCGSTATSTLATSSSTALA